MEASRRGLRSQNLPASYCNYRRSMLDRMKKQVMQAQQSACDPCLALFTPNHLTRFFSQVVAAATAR